MQLRVRTPESKPDAVRTTWVRTLGTDDAAPVPLLIYNFNDLTVAQLVERGTVIALQRISLGRWFESVR